MTVELERIEARFAVGEGTSDDLDLYQKASGSLRRLLESVGLQRRPRDAEDLAAYIAQNYGDRSGKAAGTEEPDPATVLPAPLAEEGAETAREASEADPAPREGADETLTGALPPAAGPSP
jgi:hypothetical protein